MLQRVRIQNFKSLKDVTLDLQKVNLFIGPNNSGKSNFLKGLELFKNIEKNFIDNENVGLWFKISDIFEKNKANEVLFSLTMDKVQPGNKQNKASLGIKFGEYKSNKISDFNETGLFISNFDFWQDALLGGNQVKRFMDIEDRFFPIRYYFSEYFKNVEIYKPNPTKLVSPFPILPDQSIVNSDASNLIAFFDTLRDKYPDNFKSIESDLTKCIPELSGLRFENVEVKPDQDLFKIYGDKTFKRLGIFDQIKRITYWADEVSEGVLYFLALLCIVHQPNPPKLLLLEEPEKGIHPRRIKEVLDFIFQLAEEKDIQVILTTHNERVLDEFADIPEAVFVFDKDEEGATIVKNLQKDIIEPSDKEMEEKGYPKIKFTESLGSHWLTGFIGGVPK